MTQKRFKKMLMSKGYSRNAVNKIAKETARSGKTYAKTYEKIVGKLTINLSFASDASETALKKLSEMAVTCAANIKVFGMKIRETLEEATKENTKNLTREDD